MKKIICITILSVLSSGLAYPGCGAVNIVITNSTAELCKLKNSDLVHGYFDYVSSAPAFIPPHFTASPIILSESFYGSELLLTYECGNDRRINISNLHHYYLFGAGVVEGKVLFAKHLQARVHALMGSCLWNQHGTLDWLIEDNETKSSSPPSQIVR